MIFFMIGPQPPKATRSDTLCPDTTLVRAGRRSARRAGGRPVALHPRIGRQGAAGGRAEDGRREGRRREAALCARGQPVSLLPQHPGAWRPRSEEHTSELQSLIRISYAVFCLIKNKHNNYHIISI